MVYIEGRNHVIVETDSIEAFVAIKFQHVDLPQDAAFILQQIRILKRDMSWRCNIKFVFPRRNGVAIYLALLGGELFTRLFLFFEPIGRVAELMDLDIGLGPHGPQFLEVEMNEDEMMQMEEMMENGAVVGAAEAFAQNGGFNGRGGDLEIHDVMLEDEFGEDDEECAPLP